MQSNVVNRIWYSLVRWCPGAHVLCARIIGPSGRRPALHTHAHGMQMRELVANYYFMGAGAGCPVYAGLLLQVKGAGFAKRTKLSCACTPESTAKKIPLP